MRVVTLNANGTRSACKKGLVEFLGDLAADIVCLQEVRAHETDIPAALASLDGYRAFWHCAQRKGYSGVGILSRREPDRVECGIGHPDHDAEGRVLRADFGPLSVLSVYVPSGTTGEERQAVKMRFLSVLLEHLTRLALEGRELIVAGDFNIAHRAIDLRNWRSNQKNSGFLPEERAWIDSLLAAGLVDTYRELVGPDARHYSWWSNRGGARQNDVGWRLDYQFATPATAARARDPRIAREPALSDHAPVTLDYDLG